VWPLLFTFGTPRGRLYGQTGVLSLDPASAGAVQRDAELRYGCVRPAAGANYVAFERKPKVLLIRARHFVGHHHDVTPERKPGLYAAGANNTVSRRASLPI